MVTEPIFSPEECKSLNPERKWRFQAELRKRLRDGFANIAPAEEVPGIGKTFALAGLDGLDGTVFSVQENAGTVRGVVEGEAASVGAETGVALDEIPLVHVEESRDGGDIRVAQMDETGPTAAVCAALAHVGDARGGDVGWVRRCWGNRFGRIYAS